MRTSPTRLLLACVMLLIAGCGGAPDDMPEVAPVRGTVKLDGKPLPMAKVIFSPVEGGQSSEGVTGAGGEYELVYKRDIMGAKVGKHLVVITTYEEPEKADDNKTLIGGRPEQAPPEYNTGGGVEHEVKAGEENVIDFDLAG